MPGGPAKATAALSASLSRGEAIGLCAVTGGIEQIARRVREQLTHGACQI